MTNVVREKHHVIKYEGVISPETDGVVHHMEVFLCDEIHDVSARRFRGPCKVFGAERPTGLESCRQVVGAWAMGAVVSIVPKLTIIFQNIRCMYILQICCIYCFSH